MTPHCFDMPDDPRGLAAWLEGHLVGDSLGELIAELSAAHPFDESRSQLLTDVLGHDAATVLASGLASLAESRLRSLIRWPGVLRELQQRVLLDGGPYWQRLAKSHSFEIERERVWQRVEVAAFNPNANGVGEHDQTSSHQPVAQSWQQPLAHADGVAVKRFSRRGVAVACIAALIVVGLGVTIWRALPRSEPWGWNRPGVFAQDVASDEYLRWLADSANEYFSQPRDTAKQLEQTLTDFRRSCDVLLAAKHEPLNDDDRAWLRERCLTWSKKFDDQLAGLRRTGDTATVRATADDTVHKLVNALRTKAA